MFLITVKSGMKGCAGAVTRETMRVCDPVKGDTCLGAKGVCKHAPHGPSLTKIRIDIASCLGPSILLQYTIC